MAIHHSTLLNSDLVWTTNEELVGKKYIKWEESTILWEKVDLTWDEFFILLEVENVVRRGGGDYADYVAGNPWKNLKTDIGEEKTRKVIKLYCKVKGKEFEESMFINDTIKVTASDFEIFVVDGIKKSISVKIEI